MQYMSSVIAMLTLAGCCTPKVDTGDTSTGTETPCMEETAPVWYADSDNDGWGIDIPGSSQRSCTQPEGQWVLQSGDCDDNDSTVYPGAGC